MIKTYKAVMLFALMISFGATCSILAASKASTDKNVSKKVTIQKQKIESYAGGKGERQIGITTNTTKPSLTPLKSSSAVSPGVAIGNTWYDYQHNG